MSPIKESEAVVPATKKCLEKSSMLTIILKNKHVQAVYNFVVAVYIIMLIKVIINDMFYNGGSEFGFRIIKIAFGQLDVVFLIWCFLFIIQLSVYFGFIIWSNGRSQVTTINNLLTENISFEKATIIWDTLWCCILMISLFGTLHFAAMSCIEYKLPIASSTIILFEQVRFIMKEYAFIRENVPEILKQQKEEESKSPTFFHFLYYSFAPTLIYKNLYPRTLEIRWKYVFQSLMEVAISIHFMSLIEWEHFLNPLEDFGRDAYTAIDVVLIILSNSAIGSLYGLLFVFCMLHSFQNVFAEITTFADREFYLDWWTTTNLSDYYTNWNRLVQNWLFTYIYKDIYAISNNKMVARLSVFAISMTMHEIVFASIFRFVSPVFTYTMIVSIFLMDVKTRHRYFNISLILGAVLGYGVLFTLPHLEHYVILNCVTKSSDYGKYIPVLYSCYK